MRILIALLLLTTGCTNKQALRVPSICGNGVVEGDEQCDDGGADSLPCDYGVEDCVVCGPGCFLLNIAQYCGDGMHQPPYEECDDGALNTDEWSSTERCNTTCSGFAPRCGDGSVDSSHEVCEIGDGDVCQACSEDCSEFLPTAVCGDEVICLGQEECDDGNTEDGDACSSDCQVTAFIVNTHTDDSQRSPKVDVAADGRLCFVWESTGGQDGHGIGVFGRMFDATGNATTAEFSVNQTWERDQRSPDVAFVGDGIVAAWYETDGGMAPGMGRLRPFDASGIPEADELETAGQVFTGWLAISGTPNGGFVSVNNETSNRIVAQRYSVWGVTDGSAFTRAGLGWWDLAMHTNGDFVVATADEDCIASAADNCVLAHLVNGGDVTSFDVAEPSGRNAWVAGVAWGSTEFVVTWMETTAASEPPVFLMFRRFAADGTLLGGGEFVAEEYVTYPNVTMLKDGRVVIVYTSFVQPSPRATVLRIAADDTIVGEPLTVAEDATYPEIAATPGGGFVVTWGFNDVWAKLYPSFDQAE